MTLVRHDHKGLLRACLIWLAALGWTVFALWFYFRSPWRVVPDRTPLPPGTYCIGACFGFPNSNPGTPQVGLAIVEGLITLGLILGAIRREITWKAYGAAVLFMGIYLVTYTA